MSFLWIFPPLAKDGIGGGLTIAPNVGTPDGSITFGLSMAEKVGNATGSISDIVGGKGAGSSTGLGPVSVGYSESYNERGVTTYRNYGLGIAPVTSRDIPSPFIASYNTTPISYQIPLFILKF